MKMLLVEAKAVSNQAFVMINNCGLHCSLKVVAL